MLRFVDVTAGYADKPVLKNVSFDVPAGSFTTLIGPNGCGKTTLLRTAARQLRPISGSVLLKGRPVEDYERKALAREMALLPQARDIPAITVGTLVSHGRYPHLGLSRMLRPADRKIVAEAMSATGVADMAERELRTLSGGERQRAYIAMALAQDTDVILLDEPTTYLDMSHQFAVMELLKKLNVDGKTVVMVLHDLSHALHYSHRIALFDGGGLVMCASPEETLKSGELERVFHVKAHPVNGVFAFSPA